MWKGKENEDDDDDSEILDGTHRKSWRHSG